MTEAQASWLMPAPVAVPRTVRVDGDVAYVPLTKGYDAVIDAADVPLVGEFTWTASCGPRTVYAYRKERIGGRSRNIIMHRAIMGYPDGLEVDHIDGNGLNNRRANLRTATKAQNQYNQGVAKHNTSGFKGVSKDRRGWRAVISIRKKQIYLGRYDTPEEAHAAYCRASLELHQGYGRTS